MSLKFDSMIVIVSGLPGSGKSYFAEKLADSLHASYLNSDRVRKWMHASGKYSSKDKMAVYVEMANQAKTLLDVKKTVVVDATFYHQDNIDLFTRLARESSADLCLIEVIAEEALIRERLEKPRRYSEADFNVYEKVKEEFEEIAAPHLKLQSTNENIVEMLDTAIHYLHECKKVR